MRKILITAFAVLTTLGAAHAQSPILKVVFPTELGKLPGKPRLHNDHDFTKEIDVAKAMLKHETAGFTVERGALKSYNIILAVKHRDKPEIELVRMEKDGANSLGFEIDWEKANGVNTNFIVKVPEGYVVLANRRVIKLGRYVEAIYTPFTANLDTPKMRANGLAYLQTVLEKAYERAKHVDSEAFPGKTVAEIVPIKVALKLAIIEHQDPSRLKTTTIGDLTNEVLTTIGANRERAYAFAISTAKARGLFQFIPRTYAAIRQQYPDAKLHAAFPAGMNDHVNAALASLLLFDSDMRQASPEQREEMLKDPEKQGGFLAISYNSGARRAVCWLARGDGCLLPETRDYKRKLAGVSSFFPY
ncbi:MAG: hypothetical protein JO019_00605 [Candidatus Kaiserbacteria bacterium]|nr:hypothetical protein [Candidatus Kaiserbacteria bacterium]